MERKGSGAGHDRSGIRITWRDGLYQLECAGSGETMRLRIYQQGLLVAEERVASAEEAYRRGHELCAALERGGAREYGQGRA